MKNKSKVYYRVASLLLGMFVFALGGQLAVWAQQEGGSQGTQLIEPTDDTSQSETVTINVKDANISEVLKAYSLQTGQSIVVGPDVVSENINVRLNNIPWKDALDVILKPYGFGYRVVGGTIVISKLENIIEVESIEPLGTKVFNLKYLDAYDIKEVCEAQLSGRGKFTILSTKGLPGWEFGGSSSGSGSSGAATEGGIRRRQQKEEIQKSKTFVITDVPASLTAIGEIIEQMDTIPAQVLIEAKFLEIGSGALTDIGLDYIGAMENVEQLTIGSSGSSTLQPTPIGDLNKVLNVTTGFPDPLQMGAAGGLSQANGLHLASAEIGESGFELLFAMVAKDDNANILSAPRVLTLNNQEAAILVGEKYPIVNSDTSSAGGSQTQSESLDYYENIGIQLNVVPQICDNTYISMIVHPAVSEINEGENPIGNNQYPRLNVREAETQVMIKSGNTAVIGGLQTERDTEIVQKIPFLGDIPFLGRLFRREYTNKKKVDLLIFIKGTIIDHEAYAAESLEQQAATEALMKGGQDQKKADDVAAMDEGAIAESEMAAMEEAPAPAVVEASAEEKEELVAFVSGKSATNGVPVEAEAADEMAEPSSM